MALSEAAKAWRDSMVGTWDVDGVTLRVFVIEKGGLAAVVADSGRMVGAGIAFGGRRVGDLPKGFEPPLARLE